MVLLSLGYFLVGRGCFLLFLGGSWMLPVISCTTIVHLNLLGYSVPSNVHGMIYCSAG